MRVWYVRDDRGCGNDEFGQLLRQWTTQPEIGQWEIEYLRWSTDLSIALGDAKPDVLVVVEPFCPPASWLEAVLSVGIGLVAAIPYRRASFYRAWAEQYPVQLIVWPADSEAIGMALFNMVANLHRQRVWLERHQQLQQRLNDRILIERAKGILVERLHISESEAYQRLRLQSRRQRRPIRDIAQNLLDAQSLLAPEKPSVEQPMHRNGQSAFNRREAEL
jgi:AmiR/NasT family two-component response regulator